MKKIKNNKGFTLVEMIIVIAVMSILAIVVSPQLIAYIEKANRGTDRQAVWEMAHAAEIAYVASEDITDKTVMVSILEDGSFSYREEDLDNEVKSVIPLTSYKFKSKLYRGGPEIPTNILITFDENDKLDIVVGENAYTALKEDYEDALAKAEASAALRSAAGSVYSSLSAEVTRLQTALDNLDYDESVKTAQSAIGGLESAVSLALEGVGLAQSAYDEAYKLYKPGTRGASSYKMLVLDPLSEAITDAKEELTKAQNDLKEAEANVESEIARWKNEATNALTTAKNNAEDKKADWDAKKDEAEADKAEADRLGALLTEKINGSDELDDHIHEVTGKNTTTEE